MPLLPAKKQLWGWAGLLLISLLAAFFRWPWWGQGLFVAMWLIYLFHSARRALLAPPALTITRDALSALAVDQPARMTLHLQAHSDKALDVTLVDHYPATVTCHAPPARLRLPAGQRATLHYGFTPRQRGDCPFAGVQVRYPTPEGLWLCNRLLPPPFVARVFPVLALPSAAPAPATFSPDAGERRSPWQRTGQEEFDHLRAYRLGDPLNRLDHKASARLRRPVTREWHFAQQQPVCVLLDASRRMSLDGALFDEALRAALHLGQQVLAQNDQFGLFPFAAGLAETGHLGRGRRYFAALQQQFYDLTPSTLPPDYQQSARDFYQRQRRAALVIVLTTLNDGDAPDLRALGQLLRRKHQLLLVSLRPPALDAPLTVDDRAAANLLGARDDYANQFAALHHALRAEKIPLQSCSPAHLARTLTQIYWQHKRG